MRGSASGLPTRARQRRRPSPFDTPFDVAPGEQGPVELLKLADGVGDGEKPPGFARTVEVLSAKGTAGPPSGGGDRFAREASAGMSDRPGRRACGRARGRWSVRLEVGAGGGGSGPGWRRPPRRRRRARPRVASTAPAPKSGLERPGGPQRAPGRPSDRPTPRPRRAFRGSCRPGLSRRPPPPRAPQRTQRPRADRPGLLAGQESSQFLARGCRQRIDVRAAFTH